MSLLNPDSAVRPPLLWYFALALLLYTAWAWAGLRPSFHRYGVWIAYGMGLVLFLQGPAENRKALIRDPIFSIGLAFLSLLTLQWWNAGRELVFDEDLYEWIYTSPRFPDLPFAFTKPEAWQMITWFLPAWLLVLALRSPRFTPQATDSLLYAVAISSGLLALFGLIQWFSGTREVYWVTPFQASFFASFAYRNHAASYFSLATCIATGLLFREIFSSTTVRTRRRIILATAMSLCLAGLVFCGSRAGLFFALFLLLTFSGVAGRRLWARRTPVQRLHMTGLLLALTGLTAFALLTIDTDRIPERLKPLAVKRITQNLERTGELNLSLSPEVRSTLALAAVNIWRDHPWFGVGGWGFRYLFAFHIPPEKWGMVERSGRANVHMDALQFLAEFGTLGFGLMFLTLGLLIRDVLRTTRRNDPLPPLLTLGLAIVVIHSLIDLPLRSPAILYVWLAVLTALPATTRLEFGQTSRDTYRNKTCGAES